MIPPRTGSTYKTSFPPKCKEKRSTPPRPTVSCTFAGALAARAQIAPAVGGHGPEARGEPVADISSFHIGLGLHDRLAPCVPAVTENSPLGAESPYETSFCTKCKGRIQKI